MRFPRLRKESAQGERLDLSSGQPDAAAEELTSLAFSRRGAIFGGAQLAAALVTTKSAPATSVLPGTLAKPVEVVKVKSRLGKAATKLFLAQMRDNPDFRLGVEHINALMDSSTIGLLQQFMADPKQIPSEWKIDTYQVHWYAKKGAVDWYDCQPLRELEYSLRDLSECGLKVEDLNDPELFRDILADIPDLDEYDVERLEQIKNIPTALRQIFGDRLPPEAEITTKAVRQFVKERRVDGVMACLDHLSLHPEDWRHFDSKGERHVLESLLDDMEKTDPRYERIHQACDYLKIGEREPFENVRKQEFQEEKHERNVRRQTFDYIADPIDLDVYVVGSAHAYDFFDKRYPVRIHITDNPHSIGYRDFYYSGLARETAGMQTGENYVLRPQGNCVKVAVIDSELLEYFRARLAQPDFDDEPSACRREGSMGWGPGMFKGMAPG